MNSTREVFHRLAGEVADVLPFDHVSRLDDEALVEATEAVEELGRRVDALRTATAGELAARSRNGLGPDGLACRKGCRSAKELLERLTLISGASAARRVRVGSATGRDVSVSGQEIPPAFPAVAHALKEGLLAVEAAEVIVQELGKLPAHIDRGDVHAAESELVAAATGAAPAGIPGEGGLPVPVEEVRLLTSVWVAFLDPDGVEPAEEKALARRGLHLGRLREGLIPISGALLPEVAGRLTRLFDAYLSPRTGPAFLAAVEDAERAAAVPAVKDPRSRDQQRHDVLAGVLDIAARSAEAPSIGGAAPTVLVSVRKEDLEAATGAGWVDGLDAPVSMRTIRRLSCTGGTQQVALDEDGRIIRLGSPHRCFTAQQRRAITLRDGGCLIPGCTIPAAWCEIHHVTEAANDGPTHTDNGVLLCWFHHHTIDTSGWQIRMAHGTPQIKAPPWLRVGDGWHPTTKSRTRLVDRLGRGRTG